MIYYFTIINKYNRKKEYKKLFNDIYSLNNYIIKLEINGNIVKYKKQILEDKKALSNQR